MLPKKQCLTCLRAALFFILLGANLSFAQRSVSFIARRDIPHRWNVTATAIGDFNNDNYPDLVVAAPGSGSFRGPYVTIYLGNGDGTFRSQRTFGVWSTPTAIAVGDFNEDNRLDLAVATVNACCPDTPARVTILMGNGDGTFRAGPDIEVGAASSSIIAGDFNGDMHLDLAVANERSSTITILVGQGDGSFRSVQSLGFGNGPSSVIAGDFNGDTILDLAVAGTLVPGTCLAP